MSINDGRDTTNEIDPIDREAASIDARSEDAREQIAELVEHADKVGRHIEDSPIQPADEAVTEKSADDPAVTGEIDGD